MAEFANRVRETTTTTGTGTLNLGGAVDGYRAFMDEVSNGATVYYLIVDDIDEPTEYEFGTGDITDGSPDTLSRDSILGSSNSDSAVDWGAGTKYVMCTYVAEGLAVASQNQAFTGNNTFAGTTALNGVTTMGSQWRAAVGTNVASATTMELPDDGNIFTVTGTNTVTKITGAPAGTFFILIAASTFVIDYDGDNIRLPFSSTGTYTFTAGETWLMYAHATGKVTFVCGTVFYASGAATEAASSILIPLATANVHRHPGAMKFWVLANLAASVVASYNVTSITDNGAGDWTVVIATDFSSGNWAHTIQGNSTSIGDWAWCAIAKAAGTIRINRFDQAAFNLSESNADALTVGGFGDQ